MLRADGVSHGHATKNHVLSAIAICLGLGIEIKVCEVRFSDRLNESSKRA